MKNTLTDLNNYLFEQIERLNDDSLTEDQLEREIRKSEAVVKIGETIIDNGRLALKAIEHADEYGYGQRRELPFMLESKEAK